MFVKDCGLTFQGPAQGNSFIDREHTRRVNPWLRTSEPNPASPWLDAQAQVKYVQDKLGQRVSGQGQ